MRMSLTAAVAMLAMAQLAVAGNLPANTRKPTSIPAEKLGLALQALAKQRGFQLVYVSEQVDHQRTRGAKGDLTVEQALGQLLRGTDLKFQKVTHNGVSIIPVSTKADSPSGASPHVAVGRQDKSNGDQKAQRSFHGAFPLAQADQSAPQSAASLALGKTAGLAPSGQLHEIVVTATGTNIAGIAPVGMESVTLGRKEILSSGLTDAYSVLQQLPQVVNSAPAGVANYRLGGTSGYGSAYGGVNTSQGTAINLRGLGPQATLILVDGHRVTPSGTAGVFTPADQIPVAALQSIQIIEDGNSAIYGSDAVGGVINYVIRKDMNGVEIAPRATWTHGYDEQGISLVGGHTWSSLGSLGGGNFMVAVDYDHRGAMRYTSSPYLSDNLTQFGGLNNEIRGSALGGSVTTGAVNGGVGPGQPGQAPNTSGGTGPVANPGAASNVGWCDNYNPFGSCATYLYRALPSGSGVPTYAQTLAQPNLADRAPQQDFFGRLWRYQLAAFYNQQLGPRVRVSFEGFWTKQDIWTSASQYNSSGLPIVTVDPTSPYYIAPPSPAGGPMTIDMSPSALGLPLWYTDNPDTNWTAITGVKASLWADWMADFSVTVGRDVTCGECQIGDQVDSGALQYAVNQGQINPLSSARLTAAQLAMFMGSNVQWSHMGIEDYVLKLNGTLFHLPAGPLKAAFGTEFQHNTESIANGASRTDIPSQGIQESSALPPVGYEGVGCSAPLTCPPRTRPNQFAWDNINGKSRRIASAFAEFYVPLVAPHSHVPLVRSLTLDAAERYDHYSDFGGTQNPKISFTWAVNRDLKFNGSWGTSYRAPSLVDINPFVFSVKVPISGFPNFTGDPAIPGFSPVPGLKLSNVGYMIGDQTHLQPERAHTWSLGFDLKPRAVRGLELSTTYYHIHYTNEIFAPPVFPGVMLNPATYQLYKAYVHPVNNPADCSASNPHYDPSLQPFINAVAIYGIVTPAQLCGIQVWIDGRNTNIGDMTEAGVDMNVKYHVRDALGSWMFGLDATKVVTQLLKPVSTAPQTSILGKLGSGGNVPWRGRGTLGWSRGPLSATLFVNYTGTYVNNNPLPGRSDSQVASWTTFDLNLGFDFGALYSSGFMQNTRLSLSAQNLFARNPPLVLTATGASFDANNANIFGRIVSLQLSMGF